MTPLATPAALLLLFYLISTSIGFYQSWAPASLQQLWMVVLLSAFCLLGCRKLGKTKPHTAWMLAAWLGICLANLSLFEMRRAMEQAGAWRGLFAGQHRWVGSVIGRVEERQPRQMTLLTETILAPDSGQYFASQKRLRLYVANRALQFARGSRVDCRVELRRPRRATTPGGFDQLLYQLGSDIDGSGRVHHCKLLASTPLPSISEGLRQKMRGLVENAIDAAGSRESQVVLKAMILGDKQRLTPKLHQDFRRTGLYHLLVVSGSNLGLLGLIVYAVVVAAVSLYPGWLRRLDRRLIGRGVAWLAMAAYLYLVGDQPPVVRAFVLASLFFLVFLWRRHFAILYGLVLTVILLLVARPFYLFSVSFQLTVMATLAVVLGMQAMQPWRQRIIAAIRPLWAARTLGYVLVLAAISTVVFLMTLPIVMHHFQQVTLWTIVNNLVYAPLIGGLITPLAFIGALLAPFSLSAAHWPLALAAFFTDGVLVHVEKLAGWPGAAVDLPRMPLGWYLTWYLFWFICLMRPLGYWRIRCAVFSLLLALPMQLYFGWSLTHRLQAALLDVGNGQALVIEQFAPFRLRKTWMVDTGTPSSCERTVLPYLRSRGIRRLEAIFVSHWQNDHAGCVQALHRQLEIGQVYGSSRPFSKNLPPIKTLAAGNAFAYGRLQIEILHPQSGPLPKKINNRSLVLLLTYATGKAGMPPFRWLIPGDIEKSAERGLKLPRVDWLVAPHHGSATSSSEPFVKQVRPKALLVSRRRPGAPKVLQRYRGRGTQIFETRSLGSILMTLKPHQTAIAGYSCDPLGNPYNGWAKECP